MVMVANENGWSARTRTLCCDPVCVVPPVVVERCAPPNSMVARFHAVADSPPTLKRSTYGTPVVRLRSVRCALAVRPSEKFSQYADRAVR